MRGTYTATQSEAELDAIYREGRYGITSGWIEGQLSGSVLTGYWYEPMTSAALQVACDIERDGTLVYGRFTLTFNADRTAFTGLRTSCDVTPQPVEHAYETWNGPLIRRQPADATQAATTTLPFGAATMRRGIGPACRSSCNARPNRPADRPRSPEAAAARTCSAEAARGRR